MSFCGGKTEMCDSCLVTLLHRPPVNATDVTLNPTLSLIFGWYGC